MKTKSGKVSSGYHFITFMMAVNDSSAPPSPHNMRAAKAPTKPITAKTRCPVRSSSIIPENMRTAMTS